MIRRLLTSIGLSLPLALILSGAASAAPPLLLPDFTFHGFDASILSALSYNAASVVYYREFASITPPQTEKRRQYEAIGCHPFHVLKEGKLDESGFDCRSFFCVGYERGPKQCRDRSGKAYGGVVEISRRLGLTYIAEKPKGFDLFPPEDRTEHMREKLSALQMLKCTPSYLMSFDVAVGEGYACEEIGQYPFFSGKQSCTDDWQKEGGLVCDVQGREEELAFRREIMERYYGVVFSSSSSSSSSSVASSSSSSAKPVPVFPDVLQGKYGYTAIMDLAAHGIVRGYSDGTFRPAGKVNRAEFTKLLIAGVAYAELDEAGNCFPDVPFDQWFSMYVCMAKRLGWLQGYPDGLFRPERPITRAEALKVVMSSLGIPMESAVPLPAGVPSTAWYAPYVRKAVEVGVLLEQSFSGSEDATRADAAVWIYRARKVLSAQGGGG